MPIPISKWVSWLKSRPMKWLFALSLIALLAVGSQGYLEPVKEILESDRLTISFGDKSFSLYTILKGMIALILLLWAASFLADIGEKYLKGMKSLRASNRALLTKAFQIIVYFLAFLITLDVLGIDLTALTVFGGAVGIGVGFGLQKVTSNFISGVILLFEKSIEEDDLIELDDGTYGFIRHTGARYTLIETFDGKEIMVPNEDFITSHVTNWTFSNSKGRVEFTVGVSYNSDIEKARELMLEAAKEHPRNSKEQEPQCFLREFGDSSVNFLIYFWVEDVREGRYEPQSDVMRSIWRKFKENNIEIPFPQRDLHIKTLDIKHWEALNKSE